MALAVERLDGEGIVLAAPLEPNINDKGTAFGGALVSLMILAGWSLPRLLLRRAGRQADLVIGRCEVRFVAPVKGPMRAECTWPDPGECRKFLDDLERKGRASLALMPRLRAVDAGAGEVAASLQARYAALAGANRAPDSPNSSGVTR